MMNRGKAIEILESGSWSGYDDEEIAEAVKMGAEALKERICPVYSDNEVKQPCINCLDCELKKIHGDCRDRLKEVFREYSSISGDMFHLSEIERIIDGEVWI